MILDNFQFKLKYRRIPVIRLLTSPMPKTGQYVGGVNVSGQVAHSAAKTKIS